MHYHILAFDSQRDDVEFVDDYDTADFDPTVFWEGRPYRGEIPSDVRLFIPDSGELLPADLLANPISWVVVSERMLDLVWPLVQNDVQVFDAPVFRRSSGKRVLGYKLLNLVRLVDCVDEEHSKPRRPSTEEAQSYTELWIKASRVGACHMFRCKGSPYRVVCDDSLADALVGKGLRGVAFIRLKSS